MKIYLIGFMGCGKTTTGKHLAKQLGYTFLDLDHFVEEKSKKTISQIFAEFGETEFREIEKQTLLETFSFDNVIIATGGGTPCFFDNMDQINLNGISLYLKLDIRSLSWRLSKENSKRPLLKEKSKVEIENYISDTLAQREPFYNKAKFIIDIKNLNLKDEIILIQEKLNNLII